MAGQTGATKQKEAGEAEVVKIPSGKEVATMMNTQIDAYTRWIADNLAGKGPENIPQKVRSIAEATGFWDEEKGITDMKKFAGYINGLLKESMKMMGKTGCFNEMCDGARIGQPITISQELTFEGSSKYDVSNGTLMDILNGFGKHLDRAKGEGESIAVNFKSVGISDDEQFVAVKLDWVGNVKPVEMEISRNETNEFTGKKKHEPA